MLSIASSLAAGSVASAKPPSSHSNVDEAFIPPADRLERAPVRRLDATDTDAAIFAKVRDGVIEGEFFFDGPRIAAALTGVVTGCLQQSMLALYGSAESFAQASGQAVSVGLQNASSGALHAAWSVSTWPMRRITRMFMPVPASA